MFFLFFSLLLPLSDENSKRIVLALQSGLKSEMTWALNAITVLSFKEKDDLRRDSVPLCKIPGLLDAILQVVRAKTIFLSSEIIKSFIKW